MAWRTLEPVPDCWDDEVEALVQRCVVVFGEDTVDGAVVRLIECHCELDSGEGPMPECVAPILVDAIKAECRRLLRPH